jgi:hypothetical protein
MPSLALVMPVISLFIALFPSLIASVARRAFLGVSVAIIFEYLLDNLGLEFSVGPFGDFGQIEVLDWIAVRVELFFNAAASASLLERSPLTALTALSISMAASYAWKA